MDSKIKLTLNKIEEYSKNVVTAIVPRPTGEILRMLTLSLGAKKVLEIGSSVGYSTIWFASALKETGGHIYTTEISDDRKEIAKTNFNESGLCKQITLYEKDALEVMSNWKHGTLDIVFIDAMKRDYLKYYLAALPLVRQGGMIIADDVIKLKDKMQDFLDYIKEDTSVETITLELDDGVMLIYKF